MERGAVPRSRRVYGEAKPRDQRSVFASPISRMTMRSTPAAEPWKCLTRKWKVGVSMNSAAQKPRPPRSATSRSLFKPCPSPVRWSGSRRSRRKAEPWLPPRCVFDKPEHTRLGGGRRLQVWSRTRPAPADPTSIVSLHDKVIAHMAIALRGWRRRNACRALGEAGRVSPVGWPDPP